MQDEKLQEMRRRQAKGMRAMSAEQMARLHSEWAEGARPRGPLTAEEQASMRNIWGNASDACRPASDRDEGHEFTREALVILAISAGAALGVVGLVWAVGEVARRFFG